MCSFSGQGFGQILYTDVESYHFCSSCYPTTHFPTQSTSNIVLCHSRPPKLHVVLAGPLTQGHELSNLTHYTLSFKGRLPFSFCLFGVPHPCLQIVCVCSRFYHFYLQEGSSDEASLCHSQKLRSWNLPVLFKKAFLFCRCFHL